MTIVADLSGNGFGVELDRNNAPGGEASDTLRGASYTGLLANKCRSHFAFAAAQKQWGGRLRMRAMDDMANFRVIWPNWYTQSSGEQSPGANLTLTASVEYPAGTRTQITFSGSASGVAAPLTELTSDPINVTIPRGAFFWLHIFGQSSAGMTYVGGSNIPFADHGSGDTFQYAPSGLTDKTMSGSYSVSDSTGGFAFSPIAIIGPTRRPSFVIIGDSRATGLGDKFGDADRQRGQFERAIGPNFAFTNLSQPSESADTYNGSGGARRRAVAAAYAPIMLCNYGTNDLGSAATATRLATLWAAAKAAAPGQKIYQGTLSPITTSTDSWATVANQTVGVNETERTTVNDAIRGRPTNLDGVIDVADVVETYRNSGKWLPALCSDGNYVFDGTHETSVACRAIAQSEVLRPNLFWRGQVIQ